MKKQAILMKHKKFHLSSTVQYYILLAPFAIMFFLFTVLPVLSSVVLSFFDFDMIKMPSFIGIENYIRMFTADELFFKVLANSLKFNCPD